MRPLKWELGGAVAGGGLGSSYIYILDYTDCESSRPPSHWMKIQNFLKERILFEAAEETSPSVLYIAHLFPTALEPGVLPHTIIYTIISFRSNFF